ncbi:uncharacterized protein LOC127263540 isoform X3 [Andrographis paniculata]|uniref:uncharacterized protein LOC127263540 isoform X3 n=1 Tax=Andrographis paniculata TaxID=175694 RepID=UPI0021E748BC|nr:uncharacterized protein LOC127263540 isoform X3 [Andrographis paniculata]
MDKNQEETIAKMRESIQKLGSSSEGFEDLSLMRFLIVRSMDASKAAKMFVEWQKWRASFVPLGHIPESEIRDELDAKKVYLQGRSRNGHSLMILKVNKHFPSKDQLHFKKFMVHLMDKTIASSIRDNAIGNERSIALVDMEEMSYKNIDIRGAITGIQILKVVFVKNEEERREMIRNIGEEVLPKEYGGQAKLVLLQHFSSPLLDN